MSEGIEKSKAGQPTKYKVEYNEQARKLCLLGATDKEMADFFEIGESTLNLWKGKYPEFLGSIKSGKELADASVADKLFNRAMGYTVKEVRLAQVEGQFTDEKEVNKEYPPDPASMMFWLKNRQPKKWREKQHLEHSGEISTITDDQLDDKIGKLLNKGE